VRIRRLASTFAVGATALACLVVGAPTAGAATNGTWYFLTNATTGGSADVAFAYGKTDDTTLVGDWDGDGKDTLAVRRGNQYFLTNGTRGGSADVAFAYGKAGDDVLVGDWDGDGKATLGVRRGNQYYLTNGTRGGAADVTFAYGRPDDVVLVGDWDGDGKDTLAVRRGNQYFLTNGTMGGPADVTFGYGMPQDVVLVGDWDGDGKDTLTVRRGNQYFVSNSTRGGTADTMFPYGKPTDVVLVGDWNGDHRTTLGVRRVAGPAQLVPQGPGINPNEVTHFYVGTEEWAVPAELYETSSATADCAWTLIEGSAAWYTGDTSYGAGLPMYLDLSGGGITHVQITDVCRTWHQAFPGDPPHIDPTPSDGQYRVGIDVAPGTYTTVAAATCDVVAVSSFRMSGYEPFDGATAYPGRLRSGDYPAGAQVTWTINQGDFGFVSRGCGTWTKVG